MRRPHERDPLAHPSFGLAMGFAKSSTYALPVVPGVAKLPRGSISTLLYISAGTNTRLLRDVSALGVEWG
jgi:hypothetical protein